jgi:hypothetical protein
MGTSVQMIDRIYAHLARDSEAGIVARLNARVAASGRSARVRNPRKSLRDWAVLVDLALLLLVLAAIAYFGLWRYFLSD